MDILFYHLTITPLLRGLPKLISKMFEAGQRVFILCRDAEQLSELDTLLWTFSQKEFIPHDVVGCQNPELQPILLGTTLSTVNKPDVALILNGLLIPHQSSRDLDFLRSASDLENLVPGIQVAQETGSRLAADLSQAHGLARSASVRDDNVGGGFSKYVYVFYGNRDETEVMAMCNMYDDYKHKGFNPVFWQQRDDGKWVQADASNLGLCRPV